jgi:hypothetical protein
MTTSAVDDFEYIRRRAEEIKAERNLALTGSTLEEQPQGCRPDESAVATDWPVPGAPYFTYQNDADGMTPGMWNDAYRQFIIDAGGSTFNLPDLRGRVKPE